MVRLICRWTTCKPTSNGKVNKIFSMNINLKIGFKGLIDPQQT